MKFTLQYKIVKCSALSSQYKFFFLVPTNHKQVMTHEGAVAERSKAINAFGGEDNENQKIPGLPPGLGNLKKQVMAIEKAEAST